MQSFSSEVMFTVIRSGMRLPVRTGRTWLSRQFTQTPVRHSNNSDVPDAISFPLNESTFSKLRDSMIARKFPVVLDVASSTPDASLNVTLADFMPMRNRKDKITLSGAVPSLIEFGKHLIYFPPQQRLSELLPDGTDPGQSPGFPFSKRMWAGGRISQTFKGTGRRSPFGGVTPYITQESVAACTERIVDVKLKGQDQNQKLFVTIERRIGPMPMGGEVSLKTVKPLERFEESVRRHLSKTYNCAVIERRDLVFMVPKEALPDVEQQQRVSNGDSEKSTRKPPPSPGKPDFSISFTPTESLLFRFSALTFNAHRIHLDRQYCRDVEGHRNLLFHGPLSCTVMLEALRIHLEDSIEKTATISDFTYRNLAPLYAEEELKICVRRKEKDLTIDRNAEGVALVHEENAETNEELHGVENTFSEADAEGILPYDGLRYAQFDCWVENADGRTCVRGTAIVELERSQGHRNS